MSLTIEQLLLVAIKSYVNAGDLVKDAKVLFDNQRWARTLYLCCIADEELAKSSLSLSAVVRLRLGEFDEAKEKQYRKRFSSHRSKTGTLHAIEDFFWSNRTMTDILQKLNAGDSETTDKERIKLSSLYADFDGVGALSPGDWFTTKEKVEGSLRLTRRRMEIFQANVVPIFDVVAICDIEQCRTWMNNIKEIV